jgi:hypothetical protein
MYDNYTSWNSLHLGGDSLVKSKYFSLYILNIISTKRDQTAKGSQYLYN